MARYSASQNKVVGRYESGTYGTPMAGSPGFWIGQVVSNAIDDAENKIPTRYLGTATRSLDGMDEGVRDVTGTINFRTQNFRLPLYSIGSLVETTSGTNVMHYKATEIGTTVKQNPFVSGQYNPPMSFTLEDSKQALSGTGLFFIRTINGCIPDVCRITASPTEVVTTEVDYIGQTLTFSSGATTTVTEITDTPYAFGDVTLTMAGSGVTAKEVTLEINQNHTGPHYLDGTRDISTPYPGNRDYSLDVTMDLDSNMARIWYEQYYKSGSVFNTTLDFNRNLGTTVGSQHAIFYLSGCHVTNMDNPSEVEGVNESTLEIIPESIFAEEYTQHILVGVSGII